MTMQQTINVPADRRVYFDFLAPQEIPTGEAKIEFTITPFRSPRPDTVRMPSRSDTLPPKPKNAPEGCNFWQDRVRAIENPLAWLDAHGPFEGPSVDEFLAERHAENQREEAKLDAMFHRKRERPE